MPIVTTKALSKRFGRKLAVDQFDLTIERGDIYGPIGKNGAGKTTFMRLLLGTAFPSSGSIDLFDGMPLPAARQKIGALVEAPALYRSCSALENLRRFAILTGSNDDELRRILQLVGLENTGRKPAGRFSLGMKQRLGIAIALLGKPELLVLDEPVNGLDPTGIRDIRDLILRLNREEGITFLISSHLLDELAKIVTRYGIVHEGKLIEQISTQELAGKCRQYLRLRVDDLPQAVTLLQQLLPPEQLKVDGEEILIFSGLDQGAKYNLLLSQHNILVSRIELQSEGLEEYFMERIGGHDGQAAAL